MRGRTQERIQIVEARPKIAGPRVGTIRSITSAGSPVVDFPGNPLGPQVARTVSAIPADRLGAWHRDAASVLLVFEDSDASRPVIVDAVAGEVNEHRRRKTSHAAPAPVPEPATGPADEESDRLAACIGHLVGVEADTVLVRIGGGPPRRARTAVSLRNLKDAVVVVDVGSDGLIIIGQLFACVAGGLDVGAGADLVLKGSTVTIEADVELILKSGSTTVRLDARGKASTTADQIVSTARVANKVRGGSVQLN